MPKKTTTKTPAGQPSLSPHALRGLLIAVEGVDGSGKSTQLELLDKWLSSNGFATVLTTWNSSEKIKPLVKKIKKSETVISPEAYSLLHLADFAERYDGLIRGALAAGKVVLCDRYVYTAFARDTARGLSLPWLQQTYNFAPRPDVAFYFRVPPAVALARKTSMPNFYEAGMDRGLSPNIKTSFEIFQKRVIDAYEGMANREGLTVINGETDIFVTFPKVKQIVAAKIKQKYGITI